MKNRLNTKWSQKFLYMSPSWLHFWRIRNKIWVIAIIRYLCCDEEHSGFHCCSYIDKISKCSNSNTEFLSSQSDWSRAQCAKKYVLKKHCQCTYHWNQFNMIFPKIAFLGSKTPPVPWRNDPPCWLTNF